MSAKVAIAHDERIEEAIRRALDPIDPRDLVEGRLVAVKPNETFATRDDTAGVTQGDTLRAVLRYLKDLSPGRLVVTGGAGAAETADVFEYSGMMDAVRQEGVDFVDHNREPFTRVRLDHGPHEEVVVNEFVTQIETLVSLAQLKVHQTATVTLSMKNIAMSFPAADYYGHPRSSELHPNDFFEDMHGFIAGMVKRFPIHLAVINGHPAMIGTGPLGGKAVETGLVIASRDAVAADTVGARLLGFKAQGVRHLYEAGRLGLGETDLSSIQIEGLSLDEAYRRFTGAAYGQELTLGHP
jgi:uncharacterized protein (DUF362 family)